MVKSCAKIRYFSHTTKYFTDYSALIIIYLGHAAFSSFHVKEHMFHVVEYMFYGMEHINHDMD